MTMNNNFIVAAITNIYSKCWHVDRQLINFECIFIKIAKMPCSQIESVKMIMLQVASNHFSISKMPIFAPHIFLFLIKQSCRGNNDHYPWPFDHSSVDLRNIIQKTSKKMIKITTHFPNALHQKFFYTISCVQFVVGTKSDLEQNNQ